MTIEEMIKEWSVAFNLPVDNKGAKFPDESRTELSYKLIYEEVEELREAINKKDLEAVCDAIGDTLWVVYRFMMEHGIDPQKCIHAIYKSNMSKLDYSDEDAALTYKKYLDQGVPTYVKFNIESGAVITHRKTDDKVMKSHSFEEPDFSKILQND